MADLEINVNGWRASLRGMPAAILDACLMVEDPKARFTRPFKEGRWDGFVRIHEGNKFPAGLVDYVRDFLIEEGHTVTVTRPETVEHPPIAEWSRDVLPGIELWDNQFEAGLACLQHHAGVVKSPTASGKGEMILALAMFLWQYMGWTSLVVVPKAGLVKQMVKRADKYYGNDVQVGQLGDGVKTPGVVTFATAKTMEQFQPQDRKSGRGRYAKKQRVPADPLVREVLQSVDVLFLDETHHGSSPTWSAMAMFSNAHHRYGFSGTPLRYSQIADLKMMGVTGPVIYSIEASEVIAMGVASKPKIAMVVSENATGEDLPVQWKKRRLRSGKVVPVKKHLEYADAYSKGVVHNATLNRNVIRATEWLVDRDRKVLVLCRQKAHFNNLKKLLEESGVSYEALWGDHGTDVRERVKDDMVKGRLQVILATTIFDEGEDVPGIDAVVLAEGVSSNVNAVQRIGRGMRKSKTGEVWIVDFVPTNHPSPLEHGAERAMSYEGEGYEVGVVTEWPAEGEDYDEDTLLPFEQWETFFADTNEAA